MEVAVVEVRVSSVVNCSIITSIQLLCVKWSPVPPLMPCPGTVLTIITFTIRVMFSKIINSLLLYLLYLVNEVGLE